jgi:hypothetical protein
MDIGDVYKYSKDIGEQGIWHPARIQVKLTQMAAPPILNILGNHKGSEQGEQLAGSIADIL